MAKGVIEIFIDGASRGNPGLAGSGVVIKEGKEILVRKGYFLKNATNNEAEYNALIKALEIVPEFVKNTASVIIKSDSKLLVKQMGGEYRIKSITLKPFFQKAKVLLKHCPSCEIEYLPREENILADKLANMAIDLEEDVVL